MRLATELENYDAEFDNTVILETASEEHNNILFSHQDKHQYNWTFVFTITVTCAPNELNWAKIQQLPGTLPWFSKLRKIKYVSNGGAQSTFY